MVSIHFTYIFSVPFVIIFVVVTGVYVCQYLQNVTPRLSLGTELAIQRSSLIPGGQSAILSLSGRYTGMEDYTYQITKKLANYILTAQALDIQFKNTYL